MSVLNHKLLRDLWQTKGQVIAVLAVIACGIAVYVAFNSSYRNLLLSRDVYYSQYRFHDFSVSLEKAPETAVFKIKDLPGVTAARGRIVKDVNLSVIGQDDENKIGRIVSLPEGQDSFIDGLHLVSGRFLGSEMDECLVNDKFFQVNGLKLGERIKVTVNSRRQSLKIVGTAQSPEYIYTIRNGQEMLPNPRKFGILWVQKKWAESHLDLKGSVNEIIAEVENPGHLNSLLEEAGNLLKPYGVYSKTKQKDQLSHWFFNSEIQGLKASAKVTPSIFLAIAAVILVILLSRMVSREKSQIGLLKAYGYSNTLIALHYFKFAGLIGLLSGFIGFGFGQWMGRGMIKMYVDIYTLPVLSYKIYGDLLLQSLMISLICSLGAALIVVRTVVQISPATAMRASPPRTAKKTVLERIPWLWKRFSFTYKIIFRNIARYPSRALFTIFGVMISTAIVMMGHFSGDAMSYMMDHQFNEVQREDVRVSFFIERGKGALHEAKRWPYVKKAEPMLSYPFKIKVGWKSKEILITGLPDQVSLFRLLNDKNEEVTLSKTGLTLMDITAKELGVTVGDTVKVTPLVRFEKEHEVIVSQIITQYIGSGAYMHLDALSRILGEAQVMNSLLLKVEDGKFKALSKYLKNVPALVSVEAKKEQFDNFNKTVGESMGISRFFLTFFAGVIAISVIYNSTAINITERTREMASLRVLGYTFKEVGRIIFNENLILSLFGLVLGLPTGYWMCFSMSKSFVTDVFRFPFFISQESYFLTTATILIYVFLTNFMSRWRIRKIDMVDALKSRE